jgi:amidase
MKQYADFAQQISERQDTVGPMTRTVKDAAYILQAIAGPDPSDNYTSAIPNNGSIPDYVSACKIDSLQGVRIGVARNVLDIYSAYLDAPVVEAFEQAVAEIEAAGAIIVDANFTGFEAYTSDNNETLVLNADFLVNLKTYFSELTYNPHNITDLAQLTAFTHAFPAEDYPDRDTGAWDGPEGALTQGWDNTDPRFWKAYQANLYYGGEGGILGALERTNTSAVLLPTQLSPGIPALVGSPVITVPMGFYPANWTVTKNSRGSLVSTGPRVPFGLSFMGDLWSERDLIGYAYAYEQQSKHRGDVLPYIVPNIELADVL